MRGLSQTKGHIMLNLILGGAGCGKSRRLLELIRRCAENGGSPVVFVPEQFSLEYDNKLYDALGAEYYNLTEVNGFSRFAKQIFLRYGTRKGSYANEMTRRVLMYMNLKELCAHGSLDFYSNKFKTASFVPLMLDTVKDLQLAAVNPEQLMERSRFLNGNIREKSADISLVYAGYERMLEQKGLKDALTDIAEAALIASENGYFCGKTVFIDEYKSFTADELEIIRAAFEAKDIYAAFDTDDPDSRCALFSTVNRTCGILSRLASDNATEVSRELLTGGARFKNPELAHLSQNILRPCPSGTTHCESIAIAEANDVYEECEYVCAEIHRLIREEGYKYSEIAVISRKLEDYRGIFEASAARYNLTLFMDTEKSAVSSALMRLVSDALSFAATDSFSTDLLLEYAKTQLCGITSAQTERLEIYCFHRNIEGEKWLAPFEESESVAEQARTALITPLLQLRKTLREKSGAEICRCLFDFLQEINVERSLLCSAKALRDSGNNADAENLRLLWRQLISVLDTLYSVLGDEPITVKEFGELFAISLSAAGYSAPPQVLDCITVTRMQSSRLSNPKVVFIIGANEGFFPKYTESGGLFSDRDKSRLLESGIELSNTAKQMISNESFVVYTAVSTASEKLIITYPLIDSAGAPCSEAVTLKQIKKLFDNNIFRRVSELSPLFFAATPAAAYYQYVRNYFNRGAEHSALREALLGSTEYSERIRCLDRINVRCADGLTGELARECYGSELIFSNTRLESFSKCAFMHFCKYALKLYPLRRDDIDSLARGSIVHHCVHMLFRDCGCKEGLLSLPDKEMRSRIEKYAADYVRENIPSAAERRSKLIEFENIVNEAELLSGQLCRELTQTRFDFTADSVEKQLRPLRFPLPDNAELIYSGKIDRLDSCMINGGKYIRILDYKTGNIGFSVDKIPTGTDLQLLLYLFAESEAGKAAPAGILYVPADAPKACLSRGSSAEEHRNHISKHYKMSGLLLEDFDVIAAMEEKLSAASSVAGEFIPVRINKDGTISKQSKVIPQEALLRIKKYVYGMLTDTGTDILSGSIAPSPLPNACTYCDYDNICRGFGEAVPRDITSKLESFKAVISGVSENNP